MQMMTILGLLTGSAGLVEFNPAIAQIAVAAKNKDRHRCCVAFPGLQRR